MDRDSVSLPDTKLLTMQLQRVAHKCWTLGEMLRESNAPDDQPSIWLQKGLELLAKAEAKGTTPGMQELQVSLPLFCSDGRSPCFAQQVCSRRPSDASLTHSSSRAGEGDSQPCQPRSRSERLGEAVKLVEHSCESLHY